MAIPSNPSKENRNVRAENAVNGALRAASRPGLPLGEVVRGLLQRRNLRALDLAEAVGISTTSVSKIMNGTSRPRQKTFSRMLPVLCATPEEEKILVTAFSGADLLEEEEAKPLPDDKLLERERAERFLEVKTQSIAFKRSVARELDAAGIAYQQDYCEGIYSTDFLIERDGKRIALECKFNVQRDFEKTLAIAELLQERLECDQVFVVVPYAGAVEGLEEVGDAKGIRVLAVRDICTALDLSRRLSG